MSRRHHGNRPHRTSGPPRPTDPVRSMLDAPSSAADLAGRPARPAAGGEVPAGPSAFATPAPTPDRPGSDRPIPDGRLPDIHPSDRPAPDRPTPPDSVMPGRLVADGMGANLGPFSAQSRPLDANGS